MYLAGEVTSYPTDGANDWNDPGFDDSGWLTGNAVFGYGAVGSATISTPLTNPGHTFLMRTTFEVDSIPDVLIAQVLRDDSFVLYLNGEEVARDNISGTVIPSTLADSTVGGADESTYFPFALDPSDLVPGTNTLAVELHNRGAASSDIGFDMALLTGPSEWQYLVDPVSSYPTDGPNDWNDADFDDSGWLTGEGIFGYGALGSATITTGLNSPGLTFLMRTSFEVGAVPSAVTAEILCDDGFVLYLNGEEVLRNNIPGGAVLPSTTAITAVGGSDESTFFQYALDPNDLMPGTNTLAVELHNANITSSDIGFGLDLLLDNPALRTEVVRNTRGTDSFQEGVAQRLSRDDLYAGYDAEGLYNDEDLLGDGFANGVWSSPHLHTFSDYVARSSSTLPIPPFCTLDADCDDGNACTGTETCDTGSGLCQVGTPVVCQVGESCDPMDGMCVLAPVMTSFEQGVGGYIGIQDTFLQESDPGAVNGASAEWEWDDDDPNGTDQRNFALVQFGAIFGNGPGQIPVGSTIQSATLRYTLFDPGVDAEAHEMLFAWSEADSLSSLCTDSSCDAGEEYATAVLGAALGAPTGAQTIDVTSSLQAWSTDPSLNRGWAIIPPAISGAAGGGAQVRSREFGTPSQRPGLEVVYFPPPPCAGDVDCDDGNQCTNDTCDLGTQLCEFTPNTASCDDGIGCTANDQCSGGSCQAGTPDDSLCDDAVVCTDDVCDPALGCGFPDNCTGGAVCDPGMDMCVAGPVTVMFQQGLGGYAGTVDTFIQQDPPSANNDNANLEALGWDDDDPNGTGGDVYTAIRFAGIFGSDPSQVPVGAQIIDAFLTYTVGAASGGPEGDDGLAYEVLIPWVESVSWNSFGGDPGASPGDEYDPTPVATLSATPAGTFSADISAIVQAWADDPASNHGLIVRPIPSGTNGVDLRSSEYTGDAAQRPKLTVTYMPGPSCASDLECDDGLSCTDDATQCRRAGS